MREASPDFAQPSLWGAVLGFEPPNEPRHARILGLALLALAAAILGFALAAARASIPLALLLLFCSLLIYYVADYYV